MSVRTPMYLMCRDGVFHAHYSQHQRVIKPAGLGLYWVYLLDEFCKVLMNVSNEKSLAILLIGFIAF